MEASNWVILKIRMLKMIWYPGFIANLPFLASFCVSRAISLCTAIESYHIKNISCQSCDQVAFRQMHFYTASIGGGLG
jgi:hypothetical protein